MSIFKTGRKYNSLIGRRFEGVTIAYAVEHKGVVYAFDSAVEEEVTDRFLSVPTKLVKVLIDNGSIK